MGWTTGWSRFNPQQEHINFPLASVSRQALGPTQPPVRLVPEVLTPGVKHSRGMMLTTHPHLVPRSWMSCSYTSPQAPPWCVAGLLYFYSQYSYIFSIRIWDIYSADLIFLDNEFHTSYSYSVNLNIYRNYYHIYPSAMTFFLKFLCEILDVHHTEVFDLSWQNAVFVSILPTPFMLRPSAGGLWGRVVSIKCSARYCCPKYFYLVSQFE
jgi:hypothetical protein